MKKIIFKQVWISLAFILISAAIISSLFRALTPLAIQYKGDVERTLSTLAGNPVRIDSMETGWHWFEPVIKLNQVKLVENEKVAVHLTKLVVGINLIQSLWHWQLLPGFLLLEDGRLTLRQTATGWQIEGIKIQNQKMDWLSLKPMLQAQKKVILKQINASVYLQDGSKLPFTDINLIIGRQFSHYKVKAKAVIKQAIPTKFNLLADVTMMNEGNSGLVGGKLFFSVHDLLLRQWQQFMPDSPMKVQEGRTKLKLWVDLKKGRIESSQGKIAITKLKLQDNSPRDNRTHDSRSRISDRTNDRTSYRASDRPSDRPSGRSKEQLIDTFKANLAWHLRKKGGWQLTVDQIELRQKGFTWPENALLIRSQSEGNYFVYIKHILLPALAAMPFTWPNEMTNLFNPPEQGQLQKPAVEGQLEDTQIHFRSTDGVHYLLTRFSNLGWQRPSSFDVKGISGVLHWEPSEGHLEVEGKDSQVRFSDLPLLQIPQLNTTVDWKKLDQGFRVSIARLILNHPHLLLSAQGVADEVTSKSVGPLRLQAQFFAEDATYWLRYLPYKLLKPKFAHWLQHDIKQLKKVSGELIINGVLADFPFDKHQGIFLIKSYLSGVNLFFAPKWPLTRDISAYLTIDKRNLDMDIVDARLQGIPLKTANIKVSNIGSDREILLLHAATKTEANQVLSYIKHSPLNHKLACLNQFTMKGPIDLDLKLEMPLYAGDETLAWGNLFFNKNSVCMHHDWGDVKLNQVQGKLAFDQQGIVDSQFEGKFLEGPFKIRLQSLADGAQQLHLHTQTEAHILANKLNYPIVAFLQGMLEADTLFTWRNSTREEGQVKIKTNLYGLNVTLPPPLGKKAIEKNPLLIEVNFNKQQINLKLNYNDIMQSESWFSPHQKTILFQKGSIVLGSAKQIDHLSKDKLEEGGLKIQGVVPYFDLEQWLYIKEKLEKNSSNTSFNPVNLINLKIKSAKIFNKSYKNVEIKVRKTAQKELWAIDLNQETISGNLRYSPKDNSLEGKLEKLQLDKDLFQEKSMTDSSRMKPFSNLKPDLMPNLNLGVKSFRLGDNNLGTLLLKTKRQPMTWEIESCKISSPFYQLNVKGSWQQMANEDKTSLDMDLAIFNLGKSLEDWKIMPVVEANRGRVQFHGGWSGSLPHFSLEKIKGELAISLTQGRITHLSRETEEKLGLGKLLSILSLQTIPRRLTLDFSDLSEKGYSFDKFNGNFYLANGIMTTEDSYIDGPVAYASMKGKLDIAKQYYDVNLKVNPHVIASLPIVATLAGGPVVGIATWVASKLINQGMQRISGYTYKITGPWKQPIVQEVKITPFPHPPPKKGIQPRT